MKKILFVLVFLNVTINGIAQTKTDSLLAYTLQLETVTQRELSNKKAMEKTDASFPGTIPIPPAEASYKPVHAKMSFPEGELSDAVPVQFELLNDIRYGSIIIARGCKLYGRAYIHPYGRLHASVTHYRVDSQIKHVYFDVFDEIDGRLGTIVNPVPGWSDLVNGEVQLNDINLVIAKASIHAKKSAENVRKIIKKTEAFPVMLMANYSDSTFVSQEKTGIVTAL